VAHVIKRADVRVVQRGDGAGLAVEPIAELGGGGRRGEDDLDGHGAVQPRIAGLVDLAHAACAQLGKDFVGAEPGS